MILLDCYFSPGLTIWSYTMFRFSIEDYFDIGVFEDFFLIISIWTAYLFKYDLEISLIGYIC